MQKLLKRLGGIAIGQALKIGFLKSLMRARYAVTPLGHYGLAKKKYAHFTSPIRRYADLVVHRSLFEKKPGKLPVLKRIADHISATERNSADAERDSKDVKLFAYLVGQLKSRKPHPYSGLITDLRNFGFFVDVVDLGMSGLVPLSILEDDFYELDAERNEIRGRRTRRVLRLGDTVEVEVAKVDTFKKRVDFKLVTEPRRKPTKKRPSASNSRSRGSGEPSKSDRVKRKRARKKKVAGARVSISSRRRGKAARKKAGFRGAADS